MLGNMKLQTANAGVTMPAAEMKTKTEKKHRCMVNIGLGGATLPLLK